MSDTNAAATEHQYTNHLAGENSPYLLSHAHNPVEWYPWGDEALQKARRLDRPIFLSIGYAACHWCHVMERESFENEDIARVLNEHFVSIKVDREQRPDIDQIYMSFTTALTGSGGWPMSVFLTPDLKPFFAGTYFPPDDRYGRPGFMKVITEISRAWAEEKETILRSSQDIFAQIESRLNQPRSTAPLRSELIDEAAGTLMRTVDHAYGGFGAAPKFPHAADLSLFLRYYRRTSQAAYLEAAELTLKAMARGGIYDQVGGGFARYATDQKWLVPHFEKMLYDNALLVPVYTDAFRITGNECYRDAVRGTLDYLLREMTAPNGGWYSALDADSDGEEGKFYIWSVDEIREILGADARLYLEYYNVSPGGNFEGKNILHVTDRSDVVRRDSGLDDFDGFLRDCNRRMLDARARRVRPLTDDKILTSWNGMALRAFCRGYQVTGDSRYLDAAVKNATFVHDELFRDSMLTHSYREGKHSDGQFLEDYAWYISGLLELYQVDTSGDNRRWLDFARTLADRALALFETDGEYYLRPEGRSDLIIRPRDENDGAVPAPGAIMIDNLITLSRLTGLDTYREAAEGGLKSLAGPMQRYPGGMTSAVLALDQFNGDRIDIVIIGDSPQLPDMLTEVYSRYLPGRLIAVNRDGHSDLPLFDGRTTTDGKTTAFVCRNSVCELPVTQLDDLRKQLDEL